VCVSGGGGRGRGCSHTPPPPPPAIPSPEGPPHYTHGILTNKSSFLLANVTIKGIVTKIHICEQMQIIALL
jgi:hypothetical protein